MLLKIKDDIERNNLRLGLRYPSPNPDTYLNPNPLAIKLTTFSVTSHKFVTVHDLRGHFFEEADN